MLVQLADWCYRRRRLVVTLWIAALVGSFAVANAFAFTVIPAVLVVMAASVTLLPALLGFAGRNIERWRVPFVSRDVYSYDTSRGTGGAGSSSTGRGQICSPRGRPGILPPPLLTVQGQTDGALQLAAERVGDQLREVDGVAWSSPLSSTPPATPRCCMSSRQPHPRTGPRQAWSTRCAT